MLQQPYDLYKSGWADNYIMGLINQVAQALDSSMSQEVTNRLFQEPGKDFGLDLAALNIQRGREHGIPSYNAWREWCGFPKIYRFSDLEGIMSNTTVAGYSKYYARSGHLLNFFLFPFCENSLICPEGKSMTPHRGNTVLFRSSQQLPRLCLGPSKGFLS